MAYEPMKLCSTLVRCIDPPLPPIRPVSRPSSSPMHGGRHGAPRGGMGMAPIGREDVVIRPQRGGDARGDRLLPSAEVGSALHEVLKEQVVHPGLEQPKLLHPAEDRTARGEVGRRPGHDRSDRRLLVRQVDDTSSAPSGAP